MAARIDGFFRKNRFTLIVAGILAIIAGSITFSMVSKALEPPITVGMTAREVVELFYKSMNTFDHFSMEDTITKQAGKDYINEAVNLYAFSKMRQSYDVGQTPFVDVQEWVDAGRPVLPLGKSVYGIANLSITEESPNVYIADYEKWVEDDIDEGNGNVTIHYTGVRRKDRCTLEMQKNAWIITKLERLSETDISDK